MHSKAPPLLKQPCNCPRCYSSALAKFAPWSGQKSTGKKQRWEIPAEKMKMRQPHIVPLCSSGAWTLLRETCTRSPGGAGTYSPAQGVAVAACLKTVYAQPCARMGYDNDTMTPHGFRAMARTILDEVLNYRVDYIEHQLAHAVRDANGRAYNRTSHLPERKKMMQGWADYLDNLKAQAKAGNVVTVKFGKTTPV